ncbi:Ycf66 family protein [Sphaerospermopsis reniformis]|uniref:Ycf66 family protein n=2 Tax=Sphaerospermopsis reniformis TaxID=531300 RepID=A0A480A8Q3_9CYAN|nr:Ycf66 family protein [Sphaerospermopsis reniformis]
MAHDNLEGVKKMLAYILALVVGIGSVAIYIAAFFFPEIHRKNDFIWSGVGLFYALVLWIFASRITGGLLLGHIASVALLVWFGWQTLSLRRQLTPEVQQTPIPSPELVKVSIQEQVSKFSLQEKLGQLSSLIANVFSGVKGKVQQVGNKQPVAPPEKPVVTIVDQTTLVAEQPSQTTSPMEAVTVPASETATPTAEVSQTEVVTVPASETATPTAEVSEEVSQTETKTEAKIETVSEVTHPTPPTPELVAQAQEETEEKPPISVEEVAPDAVLAPPAEAPPEKLPPSEGIGS